ncbi:MAG: hypothetical protein AB7S61_06290 [Methanoregulaceae archaeon]
MIRDRLAAMRWEALGPYREDGEVRATLQAQGMHATFEHETARSSA